MISTFGSIVGKTIVAITTGQTHTLALDSTGAVHAWGLNANGQLGNNFTIVQSTIPIAVSTFGSIVGKTVVAISAGVCHTVALDSTGQVHEWGDNTYSQLGDNTGTQRNIPIAISYGTITSLSVTAPVSTTFVPFFVIYIYIYINIYIYKYIYIYDTLSADPTNLTDATHLVPKIVPLTEPKYEMRYVAADGSIISRAAYDDALDALASGRGNEVVYRAAFVGCTYHCG